MSGDSTFSVKRIAWKDSSMVNVCDSELIGGTLAEGRVRMRLSEDYFGGEKLGEREVLELLHASSIISLAGKRSVGLAVENKLGTKEAVRLVQGVPFLMIYKFFY